MISMKTDKKSGIPRETAEKFSNLQDILKNMKRVLVAYSGGVDSTFLLKVALNVLGENVMAVIASSETYPEREYEDALRTAGKMGIEPRVIHTHELENPEFMNNPPERCYFCKKELFTRLKEIGAGENIPYVCDGANFEDRLDFRPGSEAARELGVRSPLKEAKLEKSEIRILSKELGLPTWNKPAMACLSSRFPYHTPIEKESLRRIEAAEEYIQGLGISRLRVRHHGQIARVELDPEDFSKVMNNKVRAKIVARLKELGYFYVTLDLAGYRTGSMNEPLADLSPRQKAGEDR
jgi:uncharacterized protein